METITGLLLAVSIAAVVGGVLWLFILEVQKEDKREKFIDELRKNQGKSK